MSEEEAKKKCECGYHSANFVSTIGDADRALDRVRDILKTLSLKPTEAGAPLTELSDQKRYLDSHIGFLKGYLLKQIQENCGVSLPLTSASINEAEDLIKLVDPSIEKATQLKAGYDAGMKLIEAHYNLLKELREKYL